jgi:hypothetical protein
MESMWVVVVFIYVVATVLNICFLYKKIYNKRLCISTVQVVPHAHSINCYEKILEDNDIHLHLHCITLHGNLYNQSS